MRNSIYIYITLLNLLLLNLSYAKDSERFVQIHSYLRTYQVKEKIEGNTKVQGFDYKKEALRAIDIENRLTAIMNLFLFSEDDSHLLLVWWQSKDSNVRALIAANYYSLQYEQISYLPPLDAYAKRFESKEALLRNEEIKWAQENRVKNAKDILVWINTNVKLNEKTSPKLLLIIKKYEQIEKGQ